MSGNIVLSVALEPSILLHNYLGYMVNITHCIILSENVLFKHGHLVLKSNILTLENPSTLTLTHDPKSWTQPWPSGGLLGVFPQRPGGATVPGTGESWTISEESACLPEGNHGIWNPENDSEQEKSSWPPEATPTFHGLLDTNHTLTSALWECFHTADRLNLPWS